MKPILLLGPDRPGGPTLERRHVDLLRTTLAEEAVANAAAYSSVIVINDGDAGTVRRLVKALQMHQREKHLCVGVLTYLSEAACDTGRADLLPALASLGPPLSIELNGEVLSFEYQAV